MKLLSDTYKELGIAFKFPIEIKDSNNNVTYYETSTGHWYKSKYDANNHETYYEKSNGYWYKKEYNAFGKETYHENSYGEKKGTPRSAKTCEGKVIEVDGIKYELKLK